MEKGIVKKVEEGKPWSNDKGEFIGWYVEIQQGEELLQGNFNTKKGYNSKFIEGKEATFTKAHNHQTDMWKFSWQSEDGKPYQQTAYKKDEESDSAVQASVALSYAKDAVANRNASAGYGYTIDDGNALENDAECRKAYIEDIKYTATEFLKWLKENG